MWYDILKECYNVIFQDFSISVFIGGSSILVFLEIVGFLKKRKYDVDIILEERILFLEKMLKGEMVQEFKEKVRILCLQDDLSNVLILLIFDEFVKVVRKLNYEEVDMFEELYR